MAALLVLVAGCAAPDPAAEARPCDFGPELGPTVGFLQHTTYSPGDGQPRVTANQTGPSLNISTFAGGERLDRIVDVGTFGLHRARSDRSLLLLHVRVQDTDVASPVPTDPRLDVLPQLDPGAGPYRVQACLEFQHGAPALDDIRTLTLEAKPPR